MDSYKKSFYCKCKGSKRIKRESKEGTNLSIFLRYNYSESVKKKGESKLKIENYSYKKDFNKQEFQYSAAERFELLTKIVKGANKDLLDHFKVTNEVVWGT